MNAIKKIWKKLGPGLITGASDDDPSGLATYAIAGARVGYGALWTMLYSLPLMITLQEMSARVGIASSCGLAGNIKRYYSKYLLFIIAFVVLSSNIFNIGANVSGMAASVELLIPNSSPLVAPLLIILIIFLTILLPYRKIVSIFKWLSLSLIVYIIAGVITIRDWPMLIYRILIPSVEFSKEYGVLMLAVFGTTISPYLAFWQASEEAEEVRIKNGIKSNVCVYRIVSKNELKHSNFDTASGMIFSNIIGVFVIALTSSVLFNAGLRDVETVKDAALALQPLAGPYAYILFTFGIVSAGLLAIPILAGSGAYILAEIFGWEGSLNKPFSKAKPFYIVLLVSIFFGLFINYIGLSPIKALFYTSILQGLAGPILIGTLIHMANNPAIVGPNQNSKIANVIAYLTMLLMIGGAIIFFSTL